MLKPLNFIAATVVMAMTAGSVAVAQDEAPKLSDAEIAHIVVTANTIDVDYAKIAVEKTKNAKVKEFAETMIRDHSNVNKLAGELAEKLKLTPADNSISKDLLNGAKTETAKLKSLDGAAFDKEYVNNEAGYHAAVIDALHKVLLPNTKNAELKALLEKGAPIFDMHLEHAKKLQAELNN